MPGKEAELRTLQDGVVLPERRDDRLIPSASGSSSRIAFGVLLGLGALLLLVSLALAIGIGAVPIDPGTILSALAGKGGSSDVLIPIVREIRLPRVLSAALVGGALAMVGATLQAIMKNPLADPYVLGISSSASVGAALSSVSPVYLFGVIAFPDPVASSSLAFATALLSIVVVFRVAEVDGRLPAVRLLLAGIAMSSFSMALTAFILFLAPEPASVRGLLFWLMGGLQAADWRSVGWTAAIVVPGCSLLAASARWQNLLLLGDETALSLGLDVRRTRKSLVLVSALVTATVVAFAGAIGFVGLVVPHSLRPFTGPDLRRLLPACALFGATLLVGMDALARSLLSPEEIPVGVLTAMLGAPFFIMLLARRRGVLDG